MDSTTETRPGEEQAVRSLEALNQAQAVRERAAEILSAGEQDALSHFSVHMQQLPALARQVAALCRNRFPDLDIPLHSRWRHFDCDGIDRWNHLQSSFENVHSRARAAIDLAVTSVLLDAGAGTAWCYEDPVSGQQLSRSEGLALASLELFKGGRLSSKPQTPLQADAQGLMAVDDACIKEVFQVRKGNPLVGVEGRVALLNNLGGVLHDTPQLFPSTNPRPGHLYDYLKSHCEVTDNGVAPVLSAQTILRAVLKFFSRIWPGRLTIAGHQLGDVWRHPAIIRNDASTGLMPLHKLSQWLSYSLVEPLQEAGLSVVRLDELTGLAEYRNGGLFIDCGVLKLRDETALTQSFTADSELVVEWRALTVALLDRLAPLIRECLGANAQDMPLVKILEGGTWLAGRNIARELREDGGPPIRICSDGTVF